MSVTPETARYGTWRSPIEARTIAEKSISKEDILVDSKSCIIYCIESRANENGRNVVVNAETGADVFGRSWNARTRVQEYGGASAVIHDGILIFSNFEDGQVYKQALGPGETPQKVTSNPAHRFADFAVHPRYPHLIVCILEDHTHDSPDKILTSLVIIDTRLDGEEHGRVSNLISGADFYSNPRFNEDGTWLAWCQWDHPDMPWDGSQIFLAGLDVTSDKIALAPHILPVTRISGDHGRVSAIQPTWLANDSMVFLSDISGYYNPWITKLTKPEKDVVFSVSTAALLKNKVDQDFSDPSWWLGGSSIAVLDNNSVLFSASKDAQHILYIVTVDGKLLEVECPYVNILRMRSTDKRGVAFFGTTDREAKALVNCTFDESIKPSYSVVGPNVSTDKKLLDIISVPEHISLNIHPPSSSEPRTIHVLFFPPHNPEYSGPPDERPCAVVNIHGGPNSSAYKGLSMEKQYFTSRGWAWIDVIYSGSSNYGRKYIERLKGNWGVMDVEDSVYAVKELVSPKHALIDSERVVIRGGSAGGFTTLCTLCQSDPEMQVFAAGTSSFGVSDLKKLTETTHKFQSRYVQRLLGGDYQDIPEIYRARSAVFHAHNIKTPLLILQGSVDPVVPPSQAEVIVQAIKEQGGEVEYTVFEGESHGWRYAKTIEAALEKEAEFYNKKVVLTTSRAAI